MSTKALAFLIPAFILMLLPVADADDISLHGEGHGDGIDVYYALEDESVLSVSLSERPTGYVTVSVLAMDSSGEEWIVENIEKLKDFKVDLPPLHVTSYYVTVTLTDMPSILGECVLQVGSGKTLIYVANGGSGSTAPTEADAEGKVTVSQSTFTPPSGRTFLVWDIGGTTYRPGDVITINKTTEAKAIWTEVVCTVTYDPGEGSGSMPPASIVSGMTLVLPSCEFTAPEGKVFSSWSIDGKPVRSGDSIIVDRDLIVKAQWTSPSSDGEMDVTVIAAIGVVVAVALIAVIAIVLRRTV